MTENNEKDIQVTEAVAAPATETAAPATTDAARGGARRGERGDRGQGRGDRGGRGGRDGGREADRADHGVRGEALLLGQQLGQQGVLARAAPRVQQRRNREQHDVQR